MITVDFRLDDMLEVADEASWVASDAFFAGDLALIAEYHTTPNESHSYFLTHDRSAIWGVPGEPQLAAIKITRDLGERTFTFEAARHAGLAFAQNWLAERGCPPEKIIPGDDFLKPADDLTARAEQQVRESGERYRVIDTYTRDSEPCETWTLVHDSRAAELPIRVFLEEADLDAGTYTVREGAFADEWAAVAWLSERPGPLPEPPEHRATAERRTRAARSRSTGTPLSPKAGAQDSAAKPSPASQLPTRGRTL
ncbi:glycosyl hydrolase [Kitasatospora sp. NPDC049285]|uniref:glycosyl hydrolase n=1 Tax=Kitasatospora sp. NPDC049285 TaxID=3157096 RepID=UPI0034166635